MILIILLCLIASLSCEAMKMPRQCNFDGCTNLDQNEPNYNNDQYTNKLIKLFSGGIAQFIWEDTSTLIKPLIKVNAVSNECQAHMKIVSSAMVNNREWAFDLSTHQAK